MAICRTTDCIPLKCANASCLGVGDFAPSLRGARTDFCSMSHCGNRLEDASLVPQPCSGSVYPATHKGEHVENDRLDLGELGKLVAAERSRRGLSLRDAAADVGMPFNTLARVERGHVPDLPKFKRLVEWCGADINRFFDAQERAIATPEIIAEHLHADRNLAPEAAARIARIVTELYEMLASPEEVVAAHLRAAKTFRPDAAQALGALLTDLRQALLKEPMDGPTKRI